MGNVKIVKMDLNQIQQVELVSKSMFNKKKKHKTKKKMKKMNKVLRKKLKIKLKEKLKET